MKISDANTIVGTPEVNPSTPRAVDAAAQTQAPAAPSDTVTTQKKQELEKAIMQAQAQVGTGHAAELAQIAAAVKNGTYQPDPARIASRILDEAQVDARIEAMLR